MVMVVRMLRHSELLTICRRVRLREPDEVGLAVSGWCQFHGANYGNVPVSKSTVPVKKTLFSLAFVAASGVYVAAANHMFSPSEVDVPAVATTTTTPAEPLPSIKPSVATVPAVRAPQRAIIEVPQIVARVAPPSLPPLPRPRPAAPPRPVVIQPAASTDTAAAIATGYRDGTYTGSSENAYYGRVQVRVTVTNHQIANVRVLDYPQDRRTSRYINSQALPLLTHEVIAANSANVDTVSGATLTSNAYIRSLGTALGQAGGSNA